MLQNAPPKAEKQMRESKPACARVDQLQTASLGTGSGYLKFCLNSSMLPREGTNLKVLDHVVKVRGGACVPRARWRGGEAWPARTQCVLTVRARRSARLYL